MSLVIKTKAAGDGVGFTENTSLILSSDVIPSGWSQTAAALVADCSFARAEGKTSMLLLREAHFHGRRDLFSMSLNKHLDSSCAATHVSIISNKAAGAEGLKTHCAPFFCSAGSSNNASGSGLDPVCSTI